MKKTKLAVFFAALVSVLGFTSCLDDEGVSSYPAFQAAVTVTGDALTGYTFLCDAGENIKLRPTGATMAELEKLEGFKRLVIAFDLTEEYAGVTQLQPNTNYNVIVDWGYSYSFPTYSMAVDTLNTQYQSAGNDSIALNNKKIVSAESNTGYFYVKNGYMTFYPRFYYGSSPFYFGLYYDGQKDVNTTDGSLNLNLYFNNTVNGSSAMSSATSIVSLKMPIELYGQYIQAGKDSIDVTLNLNTSNNQEPLKCRMAVSDFMTPVGY